MTNYFIRPSSGGPPVGPVTLDQLRRGVEGGKVPRDSLAQMVGAQNWLPVEAVIKGSVTPVAIAPSTSPAVAPIDVAPAAVPPLAVTPSGAAAVGAPPVGAAVSPPPLLFFPASPPTYSSMRTLASVLMVVAVLNCVGGLVTALALKDIFGFAFLVVGLLAGFVLAVLSNLLEAAADTAAASARTAAATEWIARAKEWRPPAR